MMPWITAVWEQGVTQEPGSPSVLSSSGWCRAEIGTELGSQSCEIRENQTEHVYTLWISKGKQWPKNSSGIDSSQLSGSQVLNWAAPFWILQWISGNLCLQLRIPGEKKICFQVILFIYIWLTELSIECGLHWRASGPFSQRPQHLSEYPKKKERKSLSQISIQKWLGMPQKSKTLLSMPWLMFRRIPENGPDLELAWLTLGLSVLSNSVSVLSPVLCALYGERHW